MCDFWFLQTKEALSKLLEDIVDDFAVRHEDSVLPTIAVLSKLLKRPEFPSPTALCAISVVVEAISRRKLFFPSSDAVGVLDCIAQFLRCVSISGSVLSEDHLEQSLNRVRKGKLSGALVLGWCSLLWGDMNFDAHTNPDALLRAAKFVLDDVSTIRVSYFRIISTIAGDFEMLWLDRLIGWLIFDYKIKWLVDWLFKHFRSWLNCQ